MAYATVPELLAALGKSTSPENDTRAQACLDAAAIEIDHAVDRTAAIPAGNALANRVNLLRAVEWWKSNEAAFGVIGFDQTGALQAPRDGFARHERTLIPLREKFGVA